MDLKTLKDFENMNPDYTRTKYKNSMLCMGLMKDLKQEIIKRIKVWEIQKIRFKEIGNKAGAMCANQIQNEFIEFFNITEEDLK